MPSIATPPSGVLPQSSSGIPPLSLRLIGCINATDGVALLAASTGTFLCTSSRSLQDTPGPALCMRSLLQYLLQRGCVGLVLMDTPDRVCVLTPLTQDSGLLSVLTLFPPPQCIAIRMLTLILHVHVLCNILDMIFI